MRPRLRPRPNDLASPHGPRGLNIPCMECMGQLTRYLQIAVYVLKNFIGRVETAVTNPRFDPVGLDALTTVVHGRLQQQIETGQSQMSDSAPGPVLPSSGSVKNYTFLSQTTHTPV